MSESRDTSWASTTCTFVYILLFTHHIGTDIIVWNTGMSIDYPIPFITKNQWIDYPIPLYDYMGDMVLDGFYGG